MSVELVRTFKKTLIQRNTVLFKENEFCDKVYIIKKGAASFFKYSKGLMRPV